MPGTSGSASIPLGTGSSESESEQVHGPFPAHLCEIHELSGTKGPYKSSSGSSCRFGLVQEGDNLTGDRGVYAERFGSETEILDWTIFNRNPAGSVVHGDMLMVICITKPVSGLQQLEGFHSIYLKTLM